MPLNRQALDVADFSGGVVDDFLDCQPNQCERADNFVVTETRKLETRRGSRLLDAANPQLPTGQFRVGALIVHEDQLLAQSVNHIYRKNGAWSEITGPTGNFLGPNTVLQEANFIDWAQWNRHLLVVNDAFSSPQKIYKDGGGTWRLNTAGLPALAAPVVTPVAGANNYLYRFVRSFEYMIGTVTHKDFGPTTEVSALLAAAPNVSTIAITVIPVLANGSTENYATATLKVEIYRTVNNGTVFYKVGEVTNGTTTFNDTFSDAAIQANNILLYTEGGVVDNDPPPAAKFVVVASDIAWYGHVKEGTAVRTNRVRQSIKNDIDSCPESFFTDVEEEITGMGAVKGVPLVFCERSIYRLEGFVDEFGRGVVDKREVSRTIGCVSHNSIVETLQGVFFAGNDGFYFTDGYTVQKISDGINETYRGLAATEAQEKQIYGVYDVEHDRILWSVQADSSAGAPDQWFVLDLRWGIRQHSTFTTASGGDSFRPTALVILDDNVIRGDQRGYVFEHADDIFTDPEVDTLVTPADWEQQAIIYAFKSKGESFGTTSIRKWVTMMSLVAKSKTDVSIAVNTYNDGGTIAKPLQEIRYRDVLVWGDSLIEWGDPDIVWNESRTIEAKRHMRAGSLRCTHRQLELTNSFTNIYRSDDYSSGVLDQSAETLDISDSVNFDWPEDVVGYVVALENDAYVREYVVLDRVSVDQILLQDLTGDLPVDGTYKWVIRGFRKGEVLSLHSFSWYYSPLTASQLPFQGEAGANA